MKQIRRIVAKIQKTVFDIRLRKAIKIANRDSRLFGTRLLVIAFEGVPRVYEKQKLKALIKQGYYVKGTTIQELERMAYHITK